MAQRGLTIIQWRGLINVWSFKTKKKAAPVETKTPEVVTPTVTTPTVTTPTVTAPPPPPPPPPAPRPSEEFIAKKKREERVAREEARVEAEELSERERLAKRKRLRRIGGMRMLFSPLRREGPGYTRTLLGV